MTVLSRMETNAEIVRAGLDAGGSRGGGGTVGGDGEVVTGGQDQIHTAIGQDAVVTGATVPAKPVMADVTPQPGMRCERHQQVHRRSLPLRDDSAPYYPADPGRHTPDQPRGSGIRGPHPGGANASWITGGGDLAGTLIPINRLHVAVAAAGGFQGMAA